MTPVDAPPQHLTERTIRLLPDQSSEGSATRRSAEPSIVRVKVQTPAASWVRDAIAEIEQLTALSADWDTYGASPITASAATKAVRFLVDNAYAELARPSIVPMSDGGIQLEWHRGGVDLEISISDGDSGVFVAHAGAGESEEAPLSDARSHLLSRLSQLAE